MKQIDSMLPCVCSVIDLRPVHTYPDIFESATFSFEIRLPSTCIRRIRQRIRIFLNPPSRLGNKNRNEPDNVWIFESDEVAKLRPVSYRTINQYGGKTCKFAATIARSMAHALKIFYLRGALVTRVNPDTIGCV